MKTWFLAFVLAGVALAPAFYVVYNGYRTSTQPSPQAVQNEPQYTTVEFKSKTPVPLEVGSVFEVKACKVIDGYRFAMFLEGDKWIEVHLPTAAKEEATPVVIAWLKETSQPLPTVKLKRRVGNYWIAELTITVTGERRTLTELLKAKSLLLE